MRRRSIVSGYTALPYSIYLPKLKIINLFVVFWATMVSLPVLSFSRNILTASQLKLKFEFHFNDRLSAYCNFLLLPKEKKATKKKTKKSDSIPKGAVILYEWPRQFYRYPLWEMQSYDETHILMSSYFFFMGIHNGNETKTLEDPNIQREYQHSDWDRRQSNTFFSFRWHLEIALEFSSFRCDYEKC